MVQAFGQGLWVALDKMHQPQALGLDPVEACRRQRQAPGLGQADALHDKGRDLRRQQAQAGFRQAELGLMIGQGHVADAGQAKAASQHRALQHANQHLRAVLGLFQQAAKGPVQLAVGLGALGPGLDHVLEVGTGAEVAARAAQHQGPHATFPAHCRQHRAQFADHLQAHGIAGVWAIEGDVQDPAMGLQQQGLASG